MATRKTGTVTGASLESAVKGKKGGLTGSKRVTGESSTPASTPTEAQQSSESLITSLGSPTPPSIGEKLKAAAETVVNLAVDAKDTRIEDFLEDCRTHTISFFSLRYNNLDGIQKALQKAEVNEEVRRNFDKRLVDIAELKQELTDAIVEIKQLNICNPYQTRVLL